MRFKTFTLAAASAAICLSACTTQRYAVTGVERSRILVDSRYDSKIPQSDINFLAPYKSTVDSLMSPVMGVAAHEMTVGRPESELSNLLADILVWSSSEFGEKPDFAVYNIGGIRASLSKGNVTKGDILDVAPFENKICFLTLSGKDVTELFGNIASVGGEGVSHGVSLVIDRNSHKLVSATVNGKPVDPDASYRIATLDYLAQGNDKMVAFKKKTQVVSPKAEENNVRFLIEKYFQNATHEGKKVTSRIEGRIVIK